LEWEVTLVYACSDVDSVPVRCCEEKAEQKGETVVLGADFNPHLLSRAASPKKNKRLERVSGLTAEDCYLNSVTERWAVGRW